MNKYTEIQINKVTEILSRIEDSNNTVGTNCEISNLKVLSDTNNNIYVSYNYIMRGAKSENGELFLKVDKMGMESILNYTTKFTEQELRIIFKGYTNLSL